MCDSTININLTAENFLGIISTYKETIAELESKVARLNDELTIVVAERDDFKYEYERINKLYNDLVEHLRAARANKFAPSSEQLNNRQLSLFDFEELNLLREEHVEPKVTETVIQQFIRRTKQKGYIDELLAHLVTAEVEHDRPDDEKFDENGNPLIYIGREFVRYEVVAEPTQVQVIAHYRKKYKSETEDEHGITSCTVHEADVPKAFLPGSYLSPSLLSLICYNKYNLSLPLTRQEGMYKNLAGIKLSKQTMSNWVIWGSKILKPLYDELARYIKLEYIVHADESITLVLREPGKKATSKSYMFTYCTGKYAEHPIYYYEYQPSRSGEHPRKFLESFDGYLCVDGYAGYNNITEFLTSCWAHARRNFFEIVKALPEQGRKEALATKAVGYCNLLYSIEHQIAELPIKKRQKHRLERSKPVLDEFFAWLNEHKGDATGKLRTAINYCLKRQESLYRYIEDGRLEIDNNRAERSIRATVIGRKNYLFAVSVEGAIATATLYTIIETAKANNLNAYEYLNYAFTELEMNKTPAKNILPWCDTIPEHVKVKDKKA